MSRKRNPQTSLKKVDHLSRPPSETERSAGTFYLKPNRKSWTLMHETWREGKKKQERILEETYYLYGLKREMSLDQARVELQSYNRLRKHKIKDDLSQSKTLKRLQEMQKIDKSLFPPDLIEAFAHNLIATSEGKDRYKKRLQTNIIVAQEMLKSLNLRPNEFSDNISQMTNYLKEKRYSVSYCKDILSVVDKWGMFYSRKRSSFYERLPKMKRLTKRAITNNHQDKDGVRHASRSMTMPILEVMKKKINFSNLSEVKKWNWIFISFVFGLRPSEVDQALANPDIEHVNGVDVLVIDQTKLSGLDDLERIKKIPVICEEQEKALVLIKQGQAERPMPTWVNNYATEASPDQKSKLKFDLYCGRKGFTDFMLSKGQELPQISIFAGHKSIETTWKFYKDRKTVQFKPTQYTEGKKKTS